MEYEIIIGLEVHAQLLTKSKMFCTCSADYFKAPPSTLVCPVCLGMPGVLPVINKKAVEYTIMTGLALNATIARYTKFDRKNYLYPDLMKGYQISQYDTPIAKGGWLEIESNGQRKRIRIQRVHLEEDVAKMLHAGDYTLIDVNRSGVPLMEIVSEPDLRSPEEARQYLMALRSILQYLGVCSGSMQEGSFRCDANISIRPKGSPTILPKVEVKNMNSFRAVYRALQYEAERQIRLLEQGGELVQETRGWVEEKGITVPQRTKEYAHDYRYFPEPDLPPLVIDPHWVEEIAARLPELPQRRRERFIQDYGLSAYDAGLLTASKAMADFFEECTRLTGGPPEKIRARAKEVSNWLLGEFSRLLNATGMEIQETRVTPQALAELLDLIESGALSTTLAKTVFEETFYTGKSPRQVVEEKGLTQITDRAQIGRAIEEAVAQNPQAVQDYLKGKEQALKFLVGQVMKVTRGKANPSLVNSLLKEKLEGIKAGTTQP